jgi:hypothetical protein
MWRASQHGGMRSAAQRGLEEGESAQASAAFAGGR